MIVNTNPLSYSDFFLFSILDIFSDDTLITIDRRSRSNLAKIDDLWIGDPSKITDPIDQKSVFRHRNSFKFKFLYSSYRRKYDSIL